jgi:GntR family transcriptional regulator
VKILINRESSVPIRDQLIEQIGLQIASGALKGEEKLPSIRALAQRLGIHYNTVSSAYNHLAEVGLLDVRQGSGVRVAGKVRRREMDLETSSLDILLRDFLAVASDHGFSREQLQQCVSRVLSSKPVARILVVDRNKDFHSLLVAELQPHFNLPVKTVTLDELTQQTELLSDSLVVTSLYHLFVLQRLPIDPTRLVVCNVEPGRQEVDIVTALPTGAMVLLVSVSTTLLKMATNIMAAVRGEEIAIRAIAPDESRELQYAINYADTVICDLPSQDAVAKLAGAKTNVRVFRLYSPSTIELIKDRLSKWG